MSSRSLRDVFVVSNPTLLASGDSTFLGIGQLGIFNYDPKADRLATTTPTYPKNNAIQIIIGTPPVPTNILGAVADESKVSKPIKGKRITDWVGRKAERGHTQIVTLGYDGFDTTKTLTAQCEESKTVFIKLSGGPIDQGFHTEGRGYVRQYSVFSGCCDDCGDDCASVSAQNMAQDLVNQINEDPFLSLGSRTGNKLIRASVIYGEADPTPDATYKQYLLSVCDNGDEVSLGAVQAQYPGVQITQINRAGSTSTYQQVIPSASSAPAAFNDSGIPIINDCPTCPTGYTLVSSLFAAKIQRVDAGTAGALTTLKSDYSITGSESASRIIYQYGTSTYIVLSTAEITVPVGTDVITQLGQTRNTCVLTSPVTIPWTVNQTWNAYNQSYTITLEDDVCGNSRLADLQAAYPDLTIVDNGAGTGDLCVHQYETTILSLPVAPGCPPASIIWIGPDAFEGVDWEIVPHTPVASNIAVGVSIESAYVDLITSECAFDFWRYDAEPVFIEVSQHSQDYNDKPTICATEWPVTVVQESKLPIGVGSQVRDQEAFFKGYERKFRDVNPIVRQYQDSLLQTDPLKYYDQYTLAFSFSYHEFWFSEKYTDHYRVEFYFPEGTGGQFQAAINGYVASIGIDIEPVSLV